MTDEELDKLLAPVFEMIAAKFADVDRRLQTLADNIDALVAVSNNPEDLKIVKKN